MRRILVFSIAGLIILGIAGFFLFCKQRLERPEGSQEVTLTVAAGDAGLSNPFKGWALWASNLPYPGISSTMAYAGIYWSSLEPEKGVFDFAAIESSNQFDYCRKNNIRLILRVILDYPGKQNESQLPRWLFDEIGGDGTWYSSDNEIKGFSPNYENRILIEAHRRMITALGKRYDKDPVVAFIQLGSLGHYGEWNVITKAGNMPSSAITSEYVNHYVSAFPDKVFMFRRPVSQMQGLPAGIYNDMIGDAKQTDRWLNWINTGGDSEFPDMNATPDFWQKGPSGGEFAYGDPYRYLSDAMIAETTRQIIASHTSIIGPSAPTSFVDPTVRKNAEKLIKIMGYQFQIQTVSVPRIAKAGAAVTIRQAWQNQVTAQCIMNGLSLSSYGKWPCLRQKLFRIPKEPPVPMIILLWQTRL